MSYVDAIWDKEGNQIHVVERVDGKRVFQRYPTKFVAFYDDEHGDYKSVFGNPVSKITKFNYGAFQKEIREKRENNIQLYESDVNPIFRCLADNYLEKEPPVLNIGFFDIEVAQDPEHGHAPPSNPFNMITAIGLYISSIEKLICLAVKPSTYSWEEAEKICNDPSRPNTFLFDCEKEMIKQFLLLIEDCDILTGWNSTGYDIPYLVNRIRMIMDEDYNKQFCLWDLYPKQRKYMKFKKEHVTYDLIGRIHLDYLELYQKNTYSEVHSYKLDHIGFIEVKERKVPYEGTLQDLYEKDFDKFIDYNRQDVLLLVKIDKKKKFMQLANAESHATTVRLPDVLGSVKKIEQAIINEAHRRGMVVPDKKASQQPDFDDKSDESLKDNDDDDDESDAVAGAYVADPIIGIHEYIGAVDINSLYPSAIRSLNMAPETLYGQLLPTYTEEFLEERVQKGFKGAELWSGCFGTLEYDKVIQQSDDIIQVYFERENKTEEFTGKELYELIFNENSNLCISGNGTIFKTDTIGVIPGLLSKWYTERKEMQKKMYEAEENGNKVDQEYWDMRQLIQKILLNSTYGALLNPYCRFYDDRIGQSVTLTGRGITKHMISQVNAEATGKYDLKGDSIIYGDTDSCYFSTKKLLEKQMPDVKDWETDQWKQTFIDMYKTMANNVNKTFPSFMQKFYNVDPESSVIKAGLEIVGLRGLFVKKKKYAILVYEKEGHREDMAYDDPNDPKKITGPKFDSEGRRVWGKLKVMGLDLKRADTPEPVQKFLQKTLTMLLEGYEKKDIISFIKEYRKEFRKLKPWLKGSPKKVNGLSDYIERNLTATDFNKHMDLVEKLSKTKDKRQIAYLQKEIKKAKKVTIPGHVRASINWNKLLKMHDDRITTSITDGDKIIVCKLRKNPFNMVSVAYPYDEEHLPEWFKKMPFDEEEMEITLLDKKLGNFLHVLNWDLTETREDNTFSDLFEL